MIVETNKAVPTIKKFIDYIQQAINTMKLDYIDLNAGDIHRKLGGYPGKNHRMPTCCNAMRKFMVPKDIVIYQPLKGNGASLTIRYFKRIK